MGRRSRKRSVAAPERGRAGAAAEGDPGAGGAAERNRGMPSSRAERDAERRHRRATGESEDASAGRGRRARRATRERPQPPWGSFPLTELVVLVALVLVVAGFLTRTPRGQIVLLAGFALGSLAGLELAAREHFAGYRSHTTLLAGCAAFAAGAVMVLAVTGLAAPVPVVLVALAVFGVAFYVLREAFKRRSGGLGFR